MKLPEPVITIRVEGLEALGREAMRELVEALQKASRDLEQLVDLQRQANAREAR